MGRMVYYCYVRETQVVFNYSVSLHTRKLDTNLCSLGWGFTHQLPSFGAMNSHDAPFLVFWTPSLI